MSLIHPPVKTFRNLDVDETGDADLAGTARLHGLSGTNKNAAILYLKVYDKATAAASTDTPKITIGVAAGGVIPPLPLEAVGMVFELGIMLRATTGVADNDTGAPGANDLIVTGFYS